MSTPPFETPQARLARLEKACWEMRHSLRGEGWTEEDLTTAFGATGSVKPEPPAKGSPEDPLDRIYDSFTIELPEGTHPSVAVHLTAQALPEHWVKELALFCTNCEWTQASGRPPAITISARFRVPPQQANTSTQLP